MSFLPLSRFSPSLFADLHHLLARLAARPTTSALRRLYAKLDEASPWLLALTALPAQNDEDKKLVTSNTITSPEGTEVRVVDELLATTNTIASALDLSHVLSATLALLAVQQRARYPSRSDAEIAVYILYESLSSMLSFLSSLLRLTLADAAEAFDELRAYVENLLDTRTSLGQGKGDGFLVDQIMTQLDEQQARLVAVVRDGHAGGAQQLELATFRTGAIRQAQNEMAGMVVTIASAGLLKSSQVVRIVKWLKKCERPDGVVAAVLAALLAATRPLDSLEDTDPRYETVDAYIRHSKFLVLVTNLIYGETWAIPRLREAVKLQWSLFYLSALRNETTLLQTIGLDADGAERNIQDAVSSGAFQFLTGLVAALRRDADLEQTEDEQTDSLTRLAMRSKPENDSALYTQLERLVHWLAGKRHFLRNLKNKEEDVGLRRSQPNPPAANFQAFLSLVAAVYKSLPPDAAEHIWDESSFTSVVLDGRTTFPPPSFWDMIAAISRGPSCAAKAYEKLKDTRLSWASLFKFYQHYTEIMPHLFDPVKTRQPALEPMPEEEYLVLLGWTTLLAAVVRGSAVARGALLQAKPHPLQLLFDLINCDIPTDLKAAVFDAITAFCERRGDSADDEVVSKAVESYERISFADPTLEVRPGGRVAQPIGWLQRMELVEQEVGLYPLTRAYIHFLTSLIPDSGAAKGRLNNALRRGAVYILDRVLLTQSNRQYARANERWELLDAALQFIERAILAFDMSELQTGGTVRGIGSVASTLADDVGFLVLVRILSEPAIVAPLAGIIDHAENTSVPRVLRIYHRILDVQFVFSDVLLLALADPARVSTPFRKPLGFQSLDHYLLNHHLSNVTAIALDVGSDDPATALVAIKITAALAQSPLFSGSDMFRGEYSRPTNRLAGIIDASDESIRIAQAFCARLQDEGDDVTADEIKAIEQTVLKGEPVEDAASLPIVIRHVIADLLVDGTAPDVPAPNIAHFLLGFDFRLRELGLQDPRAPSSRLSCLRIVFGQLDEAEAGAGLVYAHPTLAAKSAQLVYQLFAGPATGGPTLAYADSFTAFSARQLAALPRTCPSSMIEPTGTAATPTDTVETTVEVLIAYLDFQRWILSAVALETFSTEGRGAAAEYVAAALFAGATEGEDLDEGIARPALLIDLLSNVDIAWSGADADAAQNRVLEYHASFPFDTYKRADADWYDVDALARAAAAFRRQLERSGAVTGPAVATMTAEAEYIVKRLAGRNAETEIAIAKGGLLSSWAELLKVALAMLFTHVDDDRQDVFLFELLDALLDRAAADLAPGILEILAESALVTMSALVALLADTPASSLPVDRLTATLLKVVDAATRPGTTESARGNLYAAITQYLLLTPAAVVDDTASLVLAATAAGAAPVLQRATLVALGSRRDRFVATLCRDAMDVRDVWKTQCFALLGALVGLAGAERGSDRDRGVLAPLMQGGFLVQFVRTIKDREIALQECLSPDPENLHTYWVYEAKLAFLLALAGTRRGAEDLLDAGVFETFATCAFVAVQPYGEDMDADPGARDVVDRQHRALALALEVLGRVVSSLGRGARSGAGHALSFLNAHRESLLVLLREDQQHVTAGGIAECTLIIALLAMVVHKVPADDLRSATGFGAFHLAVLSLAARFFERDAWANEFDADELADAVDKVLLLIQATLAYLCATTRGLKAGEGAPVFVTGIARANGAARYIASAPSLPTAVGLLADLLDTAQDLSNAYDDLADKLANGADLDEDDFGRVPGGAAEADGPDGLRDAFGARTAAVFNMIESLLLLIWRHLLFYANDVRGAREPVRPDSLSLSLGADLGKSGTAGAGAGAGMHVSAVRALERTAAALRAVLARADDLELSDELGRKPDAYYGMLVRRLKELCAGLTGHDEVME
ncbi:hypothetical protein Q5752_004453 [Cryptotrichosporon argae]